MQKIIYAFIIIIIAATSCKTKTVRQALVFKNADDTIAYKMIAIDTALNNCKIGDKNCAFIKINYPQFLSTDTVLNNYLNQQAINEALRNLNLNDSILAINIPTGIKDFFAEFINESKEFTATQPWDLEIIITPYGRYNNIFCLQASNYSYLGGAHPNGFSQYLNYNLDSLKPVQASDFIDINNTTFVKLGASQFVKENDMQGERNLKDAGFFWGIGEDTTKKEGEFYFNKNMFIKKDSLGFYYNPYEIAAYVYGPTTVTLPIKNIQQFIKK
jgi:Deacetylase PdaC/Protein of unknown function (DUF3298)